LLLLSGSENCKNKLQTRNVHLSIDPEHGGGTAVRNVANCHRVEQREAVKEEKKVDRICGLVVRVPGY
jgi:hypothetical protein